MILTSLFITSLHVLVIHAFPNRKEISHNITRNRERVYWIWDLVVQFINFHLVLKIKKSIEPTLRFSNLNQY